MKPEFLNRHIRFRQCLMWFGFMLFVFLFNLPLFFVYPMPDHGRMIGFGGALLCALCWVKLYNDPNESHLKEYYAEALLLIVMLALFIHWIYWA